MARIKEHYFNLNNSEFRLTYFKNENPKLFKDDIEFNGNTSEILRNYIVELGLGNTLFKNQTTQQLSSFILNHFSDKPIKNKVQSISNKKNQIKNETSQSLLDQKKLGLSENFKVVIICSSKKKKSNFDEYPDIKFNAVPNDINEFHPDDLIPNTKINWREYLVNHQNDENLLYAFDLYSRKEYRCLYEKFKKSLYILSAGWGLVEAEFKLPNYDITFSSTANETTKRSKEINEEPIYNDYKQLNASENEEIIFIGSPNYIPLFIEITKDLTNRKIIYWKNKTLKRIAPNDTFEYRYFNTNINTNWYYELANKITNGIIP